MEQNGERKGAAARWHDEFAKARALSAVTNTMRGRARRLPGNGPRAECQKQKWSGEISQHKESYAPRGEVLPFTKAVARVFRINTHAMGRPDMSSVSPRPTSLNPFAL